MPASPRPGKTSLILLVLLVAAAGGAGYATHWYLARTLAAPLPHKPAGQPVDLSGEAVVALGRIRPAGGLRPIAGPPGDQIAKLFVREGDTVAAHAVIAELASRADRKAELELLDQQIAEAEVQKKLAEISGAAEIKVAKAKLDEQTQLAPKELEAQKAKLDFLERQRAGAERRLQSMKDLQQISPNTISAQDVEAQELLLTQTAAELASGRSLLDKATLAQQTGKQVAEAQLAAAEANLQRSLREIPIETLKKKRAIAELQYDRTEVRAPAAGRVTKVAGRVGDPTAPQQPIVELADTGAMQCVAEVYETDVAKLRQWTDNGGTVKATICSRALPLDPNGKPMMLSGTVKPDRIGTVIARNTSFDVDPTADTDRRVFEVVVTLDNPADAAIAAQFLNLQTQVFFQQNK
jgi:HlyD family secretion protein